MALTFRGDKAAEALAGIIMAKHNTDGERASELDAMLRSSDAIPADLASLLQTAESAVASIAESAAEGIAEGTVETVAESENVAEGVAESEGVAGGAPGASDHMEPPGNGNAPGEHTGADIVPPGSQKRAGGDIEQLRLVSEGIAGQMDDSMVLSARSATSALSTAAQSDDTERIPAVNTHMICKGQGGSLVRCQEQYMPPPETDEPLDIAPCVQKSTKSLLLPGGTQSSVNPGRNCVPPSGATPTVLP